MSSDVEICNLALSHLGDSATIASIDPPEGSAQAEHCARFYPIARDSLLEMHPWNFATRRVSLAALNVPTWSWSYAYAVPVSCLKVISVLPYESGSDEETQPYDTEAAEDGSLIIRTNAEAATCRYIARVTDTNRMPPLFVDALARLLASYMSGPVVKGESGRKAGLEQLQVFRQVASQAMVSDSNQRMIRPDNTPSWIEAR